MILKIKTRSGVARIYDQATGKEIQNIKSAELRMIPGETPMIYIVLKAVDLKLDIKASGEVVHPEKTTSSDGTVWLRAGVLAAQVRAIGKEVAHGSQKSWEVRYSENLLKSWEGIDPENDETEVNQES